MNRGNQWLNDELPPQGHLGSLGNWDNGANVEVGRVVIFCSHGAWRWGDPSSTLLDLGQCLAAVELSLVSIG